MEYLPKTRVVVIHRPDLEVVKSQTWRAGSPTVVTLHSQTVPQLLPTFIDRVLPPPPPPKVGWGEGGGEVIKEGWGRRVGAVVPLPRWLAGRRRAARCGGQAKCSRLSHHG